MVDLEAGRNLDHRSARFHDIIMPGKSSAEIMLGAMSFVFAFAMIWQIWWLAAAGGLAFLSRYSRRRSMIVPANVSPRAKSRRIESRRGVSPALGREART